MFAFEHHQRVIAVPSHTLICRNVPDDPELRTARTPRPHQVSVDKPANLEPAPSDRKVFSVKPMFPSATNGFMSVDQEKLSQPKHQSIPRTLTKFSTQTRPFQRKKRKQPCRTIAIHMTTSCQEDISHPDRVETKSARTIGDLSVL